MPQRALKLKQASAVLKVEPKELQNLVQFGVVKPKRVDGIYLFDKEALLTAKVAFPPEGLPGYPRQCSYQSSSMSFAPPRKDSARRTRNMWSLRAVSQPRKSRSSWEFLFDRLASRLNRA